MKKILATLSLILVAGFVLANSWNVTVGTNATMVVPPAAITSSGAYATNNAYSQGDIVSNGNGFFWAVAAGTSSTNSGPSVVHGTETDGTVTWARCNKKSREVAVITNLSTNQIFCDNTASVAVNAGVPLKQDAAWLPDTENDAIYAISSQTNNSVSVHDR